MRGDGAFGLLGVFNTQAVAVFPLRLHPAAHYSIFDGHGRYAMALGGGRRSGRARAADSRLRAYLGELRRGTKETPGISAQAFNFYLNATKQFCRWMHRDRRAGESPLRRRPHRAAPAPARHRRRR